VSTEVTPALAAFRITYRIIGRLVLAWLLVLIALRLDEWWLSTTAWLIAAGFLWKVGLFAVGMALMAKRSRDGSLWRAVARAGTTLNRAVKDAA
jgi:hypothetical protein